MNNIKTFFLMFKQLVQILDRKQRRQGIILFFLLLIVSILEMLGVSVIVPFILTMLEPEKIMNNQYVKSVVNLLHIGNNHNFLYLVALCIVLVYGLKNVFILCVNYYQCNYRNALDKNLSIKMLSSYLKRPYRYFLNTNSATILQGVNSDATNVAAVVDGFSSIMAEGLTCIIIGCFLLYLNPFLAVSMLILSGVTAYIFILGFRKKIATCGDVCRNAFGQKIKNANQAVNGIKEIIVSNKRGYFINQYAEVSELAAKYNTKYLWVSKVPNRLIETVFIGGLLIVVTMSYGDSGVNGEFIAELGALAVAAVRILPSISTLTVAMNSLIYFRPSLEAAYINVKEAEKYENVNDELLSENGGRIPFENSISVDGIAWKYDDDLPFVLKGTSLEIKKGESVALIGESGAGKSTLADIILGLLKPIEGRITVDGNDIFAMLSGWSEMIGYVPQMVYLLDDTIRNNIAYGISKEKIDDNKVWSALEKAQLRKVVENLEDGLDTIVGEKGIKLSGGQRQRIAIARALYHNPDILILDEATSALDNETETAVMESIDALQGEKTLIIIAHRLTSIRNCNKIYEIKDGIAILKRYDEVFKSR